MHRLAVVGRRKTGKTSLLEELIPLLGQRGVRVAVMKHTSNPHLFDRPGSDTDRFLRAGAIRAMAISPEQTALFFPSADEETQAWQKALVEGCELFMVEGHRQAEGPKLWIAAPDDEPPSGVVAVVGESEKLPDLPHFALSEMAELADWIVGELRAGRLAETRSRITSAPPGGTGPDPGSVRRRLVTRVRGRASTPTQEEDTLVREEKVEIFLNDEPLVTVSCLPRELEEMARGFLFTEHLVEDARKVRVDIDREALLVRVEGAAREERVKEFLSGRTLTAGCGAGVKGTDEALPSSDDDGCLKMDTELAISRRYVTRLMLELRERSPLYLTTGGAHAAALAGPDEGILLLAEDIGRHTAVDKVMGKAICEGVDMRGLILVVSGRLSSEMVVKAAAARTPIVVSRSAATEMAVRLAARQLITLIGFARGGRMNIYTAPERIR